MSWLSIVVLFAVVDNVFLSRLLGVNPSPDEPARLRRAVGVGTATAILLAVAPLVAWVLNSLLFAPFGLGFLRTPAYLLVVAGLALALDALAARLAPSLARTAGFTVTSAAVVAAALGTIFIATRGSLGAGQCLIAGASAGAGYLVVLSLMATIQERLDIEQAPPALRGLPLHLVSAGLLAYAFMAFDRAFLARLLGG
jgi:Na+-translocating ferredoxin:NAD+ oxidoreductase subunit A